MPHRRLLAEIRQNVTELIRELAGAYWSVAVVRAAPRSLVDLCETAHHLLADFDDYETPARAAGWLPEPGDTLGRVYLDTTRRDGESESYYHAATWQDACARLKLEPTSRPIAECLAVSDWLAGWLRINGERVEELAGMTVWARTTSTPLGRDETIKAIWRAASSLPEANDGDRPR